MADSPDRIRKIIALLDDAATDDETRAICEARLREAFRRGPNLFKDEQAPPTAPAEAPSFNDVETSDAEPERDPEYLSFFDMDDWGSSTRNRENLVHKVDDEIIVTLFRDRRRPDYWSWSAYHEADGVRGKPRYSSYPHPNELAAMRDAWAFVSPRRRGRP
jgi:hypothetical protein